MRHKKHADKRLAGGEPHGCAPPGLPPQPPQHPGQQRRQHKILHDAYAGVGHQAQKRPQPDQIPVPVARVGERFEGIGQRLTRLPRGEIGREVVGQRLEIVDIVGGVGHHGGQRGGLVGAGGLEQHDRVGVVVHLEQFKTEKLRVQPFALQRGRRARDILPHRRAGQRIRPQQQQEQHGPAGEKRQRRARQKRRGGNFAGLHQQVHSPCGQDAKKHPTHTKYEESIPRFAPPNK